MYQGFKLEVKSKYVGSSKDKSNYSTAIKTVSLDNKSYQLGGCGVVAQKSGGKEWVPESDRGQTSDQADVGDCLAFYPLVSPLTLLAITVISLACYSAPDNGKDSPQTRSEASINHHPTNQGSDPLL